MILIGLLVLWLVAAVSLANAAQPDTATLQQQIDELKQQLAQMDELKARLEELEAQVAATEKAQKATEESLAKKEKLHKFDGYTQIRYVKDDATTGNNEFLVRRARLNLRGNVSPEVAYRFELQEDAKISGSGPGSKVQLRTAYIQHALGKNGRVRVGQTHIPWGYELQTGVPVLWTSERARFMDVLFKDQRDIGLEYEWTGEKSNSPVVNLGVFNGAGINASDNNDKKDVVARVRIPFEQGNVALSYYDGNSDPSASDAVKSGERLGVGTQLALGGLEFMGEYVDGENNGADIEGWYVQLGGKIGDTPGFIFAKYDNYDEDKDVSNDEFNRLSLGYYYDLNPKTRLSVVYEDRDVDSGYSSFTNYDDDAYYMQLQMKY